MTISEAASVPVALADAYRRTEFRVADRGWEFVLRIDEAVVGAGLVSRGVRRDPIGVHHGLESAQRTRCARGE